MPEILSNEELNALFGDPIKAEQKNVNVSEGNNMAAGEILTGEEVEHLLGVLDGKTSPFAPTPEPKQSRSDDIEHVVKQVDKSIMKKLQLMHEGLARRFAAKISKMLQSVVDVRMTTVHELCYNEFVFGCDNPSCFNLIEVELLTIIKDLSYGKTNMILDISPAIVLPMIERMLGGGREPSMTARRPLTSIEWKLAQRIIDEFLCELHVAWKDVADMKCTVTQQESNPQMIAVIKPNATVVVLCFEVGLVVQRGHIALCIPVDLVGQLTEGEQR